MGPGWTLPPIDVSLKCCVSRGVIKGTCAPRGKSGTWGRREEWRKMNGKGQLVTGGGWGWGGLKVKGMNQRWGGPGVHERMGGRGVCLRDP